METLTFAPLSSKVVAQLNALLAARPHAVTQNPPPTSASRFAAVLRAHVSTNPWGHSA